MSIRCGRSIIEPRFFNSFEGYIVVDYFSSYLNEAEVKILLRNYGVDRSLSIEVEVCGTTVERMRVGISRGEKYELSIPVKVSSGVCEAKLVVDGRTLDTYYIKALSTQVDSPTDIIVVFHSHQPPNYGPDGIYRSLWPFIYVVSPILFPYGLGPYHYQAALLKAMSGRAKLVYNLSPSLLAQWKELVERGVKSSLYGFIEPSSDVALAVKEAMDMYRDLVSSDVIEVLTSLYAHTIAGYLVDHLGLEGIVYRELEYGYSITKEFAGKPSRGVWLPEMSFSMKLIPILSSLGLEYTFLDERYHLAGAQGDKLNHFEPYIAQDTVTGETITVFFRDTELSNDIGFNTNFCSDIHAVKGAYVFASKVLEKALRNKARTLTIALDGENWMIFSRNPPATAVFMETLLKIFGETSRVNLARLTHPKDVLTRSPPTRKLRYIPSTTWLGSYTKWRGEVREHERFWAEVELRIDRFKKYIDRCGYDDKAKKAEWALWHILDSDYWWAEFWNKEAITDWIKEFDTILAQHNQRC